MKPFFLFLCLVRLSQFVQADWQYRSRPDLSPPQLNITIKATEDVAPGYLFVAPFSGFPDPGNSHGPRQAGPYIFTDKGELVWSGFASYYSGWVTNFQSTKLNGKNVLFSFEGSHTAAYGHGHGKVLFLNENYETVNVLRAANHRILDKHELHVIKEKSALIQIYHPVPLDLTEYGASPKQQWIVDAIFQEIDIETGELLFEWSSLNHVSPDESILPIYEGQAGAGYNSSDAWDYFHINSVDKDDNGDYLLSARDAAALYKINGTSGDIIWKLGGLPGKTSTSFKSDDGLTFSFQHHARFLHTSEDGFRQVISLYDNSAHGTETKNGKEVHYNTHSSGKIIEVNTKTGEANLLFNAVPPDNLLSKSQGSTQVLENGNVLVNWGSEGAVTEYNSNGKPIFHAYLDSGILGEKVQNYRAFKFVWNGFPTEKIAILNEVDDDNTYIYVSWNGDTETRTWKFYSLDDNSEKKFIGEKERSGFETKLEIKNSKYEKIFAEAYDISGKLLSSSDIVQAEKRVLPFLEKSVSSLYTFQNFFEWKVWKSNQ